jgi:phosphoribosyl 1,2-cyclic phosphate phosphodiesterase
MRLRFLGTSAGELYPGLWCRCRNCQNARLGGPQDHRRSAALFIGPDALPTSADTPSSTGGLLIDFPSEIATQADRHQVALPDLENLLVTHSHGDHWFPYLLRWRSRPNASCRPGEPAPLEVGGPRFTDLPILHIWGNAAVEAILHRELGENLTPYALEFHSIHPGAAFTAGGFAITALPANHDVGREEALHYIVQSDHHTILYGLDGDTFLPETRERLRAFRFEVVILESTYGFGDGKNHRNFARLLAEAAWFREENRMMPTGQMIATHFSPHHCPPHQETRDYLREHNVMAAWDGLEIRI